MFTTRYRAVASFVSICCTVLVFLSPFAVPRQAKAEAVTVIGGIGTVQETISAAATSLSASLQKMLGIKEWTLDGVAWGLSKRAVSSMIRSTTQWVRSGFNGSPLYVTDPGGFFLNVADEAAGEVLYGSDLAFLCSPINIRLSIQIYYNSIRNRNPLRCTLTGAAANVEQFIQGNFLAGGWPAWLNVSLTPTNAPIGGLLAGQMTLERSLAVRERGQERRIELGRGFLSIEECTPIAGPPRADGTPAQRCVTKTHGEAIAEALNRHLSYNQEAFIQADEIQELLGAVVEQGLIQGLSGLRGLFGSSGGYGGGGGGGGFPGGGSDPCANLSYFEKLNNPACATENPSAFTYNGPGSVFQSIQNEGVYQAMHRRVVSASRSIIDEAEIRGGSCGINDTIIQTATEHLDIASSSITRSQTLSLQLVQLQERIESQDPDVQLEAMSQYTQIIGSGMLHDEISNTREQFDIDTKVEDIRKLQEDIRDCPSINTSGSGGGSGGESGG